jgi:hypothetical protein
MLNIFDGIIKGAKKFMDNLENTFNKKLKDIILDIAKKHAFSNSCEHVQLETMEKLFFDCKPFLKYCGGGRSGIQEKIKALDELSTEDNFHVKKLTPEEAQELANKNIGFYIILAMMWGKLRNGSEKHHVAIVIDGVFSEKYGPCIGGGGMTQQQIDKGWVLSTASIHFTDWDKVSYYKYGYRETD